jgi:hypothetical protein
LIRSNAGTRHGIDCRLADGNGASPIMRVDLASVLSVVLRANFGRDEPVSRSARRAGRRL